MKKENSEFKKLKPLDLKKKLARTRLEHKESKLMVADLIQKRRGLIRIVAQQKREFEKFTASVDSASECFLYESSCKRYRLIGTSFESDSRPMVVGHVNYRILYMKSGASYVALLEDNEVSFEELEALPEDIMEFLDRSISFEFADDE